MNSGGVPRRQSRFSNGPGVPPGGAPPPRGGFTSSNFRPVSDNWDSLGIRSLEKAVVDLNKVIPVRAFLHSSNS